MVLADGGDFSLDFTAAEPTSYDHSTGGGAYDDRTINTDVVESLEGGDFFCEDTVTYLTQVVVDAGASGTQSIELDYSFTADTTGQSGAAFSDVTAALVNYGAVSGGDGPGGTDDGLDDDLGSTAAIESESLTGPLFQSGSDLLATVSVNDLEASEEVIVRVDVTIACDPGSSPTGNLQAALLAARVTEPEADTISVGNQTINLKNANQIIQLNPSIDIEKTPDNQTVRVGDDVTFTLTVANNGESDLNNVQVTDALCDTLNQTDNGDGDSTLAVGEIWTYECTVTAVDADFTNSATVTADDPDGRQVDDTDTADVDVIDPSIDIEKTPNTQTVVTGSSVAFDITVTNDGDVQLTNVNLTDAQCDTLTQTDNADGDAVLSVDEVWTYECTVDSATTDFTNVASVTAVDPLQGEVSDEDDAEVDVTNPSIALTKTPESQTVTVGSDVTFDIEATNDGDVDLFSINLEDAQCDALVLISNGDADSTMEPGETWTWECTVNNVTDDFTNVATINAVDEQQNPVGDEDDAEVDVVDPGILLSKTPDSQTIYVGDDATFTISATNTGDVDLFSINLEDAQCDALVLISNGDLDSTMEPGETWTWECTVNDVTDDFTNVATINAVDEQQNPVGDEDDADVDVIDPSIELEKSPDSQTVASGSDAAFTITATNTGDVELDNVVLTDAQCDSLVLTDNGNGNAVMEPGESWVWECTVNNVTAAFTNVAEVTADDPLDGDVGDEDDADVDVAAPGIVVNKTPNTQTVISGGNVTFDISATNTGDVDLFSVQIDDDLCDSLVSTGTGNGNAVMEPNETWTWECTVNNVTEDFTNVATVTAVDPFQTPVGDGDDADVEVLEPSISITKSTTTPVIDYGEDAGFMITVLNNGQVDLFGVTVDDPIAPDCDATIGNLDVGESVTYTCWLDGLTEDITNTAYAAGFDALQNPVTDNDSASVVVLTYQ
jgi:uncharacterized repeat protein (TIGR01451 family)